MTEKSGGGSFRRHLHTVADLIADYLDGLEERRVVPEVRPGDVAALLPESPPEQGESIERILDDYRRIIEPHVTHWNHPGFLAYFSSTSSEPGILGEALAAALNSNAMLWQTSPAATELEERVCEWLRQLFGLPEGFHGHINDTASMASFLALGAARHRHGDPSVLEEGMAGRDDLPRLIVYASDQAHSSIDKAVVALGLGRRNLRRIESDESFRLRADVLEAAIREDLDAGHRPVAIVATAGTTSTTSVDPLSDLADVAARKGLWLHVDAAHAGAAAVSVRRRRSLAGWERGDSIVVNPHKWMSTPIDCSVLFVRRTEDLKGAFSIVPEYLKTDPAGGSAAEGPTNLMDLGIQLGRRFRALKLWMVLRASGRSGLADQIERHCRLASELAKRIDEDPAFEVVAPVPFNTVCFRCVAPDEGERDRFNRRLLESVNRVGPVYLSHTVLGGRYVLRVAIGNPRTRGRHVDGAWELIRRTADELLERDRGGGGDADSRTLG